MRNAYNKIPPRFEMTYLADFKGETMYPVRVGETMYPVRVGVEQTGLVLAGDNGHGKPCILAVWNFQMDTFIPIPRQQTSVLGSPCEPVELTAAQQRAVQIQHINLVTRDQWIHEGE